GLALGRAFQVVDDVLDFTATEAELGKPVGSDLRQGHLTLPATRFAQARPDEWYEWMQRIPGLLKSTRAGLGPASDGASAATRTPVQDQALNALIRRIAESEGVRLALQRA